MTVPSKSESVTVKAGEAAITVHPAAADFTGHENYTLTPDKTSEDISYTYDGDTVTFTVTAVQNERKITVVTNFVVPGMTVPSKSEVVTVKAGEAAITVHPAGADFAGHQHYTLTPDRASEDISYTYEGQTVTFTVTATPNSRTVLVRFNYLYNGTVISSDEQSVTLTYGEADKTVTPAPFAVAGYYLLAPVSPVSVNYSMALEVEVIEIEALLGIVDDGDDTPQIPLGPGAPGTPIPLGVGVPSTGDHTGFSILLMAIGVAVVAFVTAVTKRSSDK